MDYGYCRRVELPMAQAIERVTETLQENGFGVLCDIDVKVTLKKKLDLDVRPYRILGACNPPLAHQALSAEPNVGLLMPCNVVVYEDEDGATQVASVDVEKLLGVVGRPELAGIAGDVNARLRASIDAIAD
jgi:uncharacterized protein (DUF302 family)